MKKGLFFIVALVILFSITQWRYQHAGWINPDICLPIPHLHHLMNRSPGTALPYPAPPDADTWSKMSAEKRLQDIHQRVRPLLMTELEQRGLKLGAKTLLRGFKESHELELWLQHPQGWQLFRTYSIAALSGKLGPKLKEGDGQTPEGLYGITTALMNPASKYHLAMNIGYPNAEDQKLGRTGSFIMIHGSNVSIGCLAMTDPVIEEIYLIIEAALAAGQTTVPVQLYPFRMTVERLAAAEDQPHHSFWLALKKLHDQPLP